MPLRQPFDLPVHHWIDTGFAIAIGARQPRSRDASLRPGTRQFPLPTLSNANTLNGSYTFTICHNTAGFSSEKTTRMTSSL